MCSWEPGRLARMNAICGRDARGPRFIKLDCLLFVFGPRKSKLDTPNARMPQPRELPIYELENSVVASLRTQSRLIVQAPTGSGKSTQIPQMLWQHGLLGGRGEVVVLQPRRLAARMLAKRVAEEERASARASVIKFDSSRA
jgi:hypothetical protein